MGIHGVLGQIVLREKMMIFFQHLATLNAKIIFPKNNDSNLHGGLKKCVKYLSNKNRKLQKHSVQVQYMIYISASNVKTLSIDKFIKGAIIG